jgi:hypothetical protein
MLASQGRCSPPKVAGLMKFGDMICYRGAKPHDSAVMYVGECRHPHHGGAGLIDMLGIPEGWIDHKDPAMWQRCTHLAKPSGLRVLVGGVDVTDGVSFKEIGGSAIQIDGLPDSDFTLEWNDV